MSHPTPTDHHAEALWARYRESGDLGALGELFDACASDLLRIAVRVTGEVDAAEDLVQETFLRALRAASRYRTRGGGVRSWLATILRNRARSASRRARASALDAESLLEESAGPVEQGAARELWARLRAAIAGLPEPYRTICGLRYRHDLDAKEIADALQRPLNTVQSQLRRGTEKLRTRMGDAAFGSVLVGSWQVQAALTPIRESVLAAASASPVVAIGTTLRVAAAVLLLIGIGVAWRLTGTEDSPSESITELRVADDSGVAASVGIPDDTAGRSAVASIDSPPVAFGELLEFRVIDGRTGAPAPGATLLHNGWRVESGGAVRNVPGVELPPDAYRRTFQLTQSNREDYWREFGRLTRADDEGRAQVPAFVASHVGARLGTLYGELDLHQDANAGKQAPYEIRVYPEGWIRVRLREADGRPAPEVSLSLGPEGGLRHTWPEWCARTDADGEATLHHVPVRARKALAQGDTHLVLQAATAAGRHRLAEWALESLLAPNENGNCLAQSHHEASLPPARGPITVRVRNPFGSTLRASSAASWIEDADIASVELMAWQPDRSIKRFSRRQLLDGVARFERPPVGHDVQVSFFHQDIDFEFNVPAASANSEPQELDVLFPGEAGATWRGRALGPDGEPLRSRFVLQLTHATVSPDGGVPTDEEGYFVLYRAAEAEACSMRLHLADVEAWPSGIHRSTTRTGLEAEVRLQAAESNAVHELGDVVFGATPVLARGRIVDSELLATSELKTYWVKRLGIEEWRDDDQLRGWGSVEGAFAEVDDAGVVTLFGVSESQRMRVGFPTHKASFAGHALPMEPVEFAPGDEDLQLTPRMGGVLEVFQEPGDVSVHVKIELERHDGQRVDEQQHYRTRRKSLGQPVAHLVWHVDPGMYRITLSCPELEESFATFKDVEVRAGETTSLLKETPFRLQDRIDWRKVDVVRASDAKPTRVKFWLLPRDRELGAREQRLGANSTLTFPRTPVLAMAIPSSDELGVVAFDPSSLPAPEARLDVPASTQFIVALPDGLAMSSVKSAWVHLEQAPALDAWRKTKPFRAALRGPLRNVNGELHGLARHAGRWRVSLRLNDGTRQSMMVNVPSMGAVVRVTFQPE